MMTSQMKKIVQIIGSLILLAGGLFKAGADNQVEFLLLEQDNTNHPQYSAQNNSHKIIEIFITTPLELDGIEVIIEAEPGCFMTLENSSPGQAGMEYSAQLVKNTLWGGTPSDLIKCLGYFARFASGDRITMATWPKTSETRFYALALERTPGPLQTRVYAIAVVGGENLPVKINSQLGEPTGVATVEENDKVSCQNYPNPANSSTAIKYHLNQPAAVKLYIFDVNGKKVQTLEQKASAGDQYFHIDLNNYSSGPYFYTLELDGKILTKKKLMVIK